MSELQEFMKVLMNEFKKMEEEAHLPEEQYNRPSLFREDIEGLYNDFLKMEEKEDQFSIEMLLKSVESNSDDLRRLEEAFKVMKHNHFQMIKALGEKVKAIQIRIKDE